MSDEESDKPVFTGPLFKKPTKKYGLIVPNKTGAKQASIPKKTLVKPCIFDDDEEEEEETSQKATNTKFTPFNSSTSQSRLKKQTQIDIEKALNEDPNVFEYDNVYDDMEKEKLKADIKEKSKNQSKEPKYIVGIMKAAAKRQMEFEKLQERKIHKERQEEGDLWADKEVFVTSAYRKKIEEREKIEAEERNQERIEELLDVRKQKDLSGFYSNLLKMKTGEMVIEEEGAKEMRLEREQREEIMKHRSVEELAKQQKKVYRSKKESSDEEEEEIVMKSENIDKDAAIEDKGGDEKDEITGKKDTDASSEPDAKKAKLESDELKSENKENEENESEPAKPKLTKEEKRALLFDKRTVGAKFDEELGEYFIRMSQNLSLKNYIERD